MIRLSPERRAAGLVGVGAVALALSYPPFHFPLLGFFAVAPAVLLLRWCEGERSPQLALHRVLDAVYRSADEGRDVLL